MWKRAADKECCSRHKGGLCSSFTITKRDQIAKMCDKVPFLNTRYEITSLADIKEKGGNAGLAKSWEQ